MCIEQVLCVVCIVHYVCMYIIICCCMNILIEHIILHGWLCSQLLLLCLVAPVSFFCLPVCPSMAAWRQQQGAR